MSVKTKKAPAAKPVAMPKPPKKLVPRTAPKAEVKPAVVVAEAVVAPAAKIAVPKPAPVVAEKPAPVVAKPAPAASKPKVVRKPTQVEETVAKHQKVLADALVKAQAIKYDQPKVMKQEAAKAAKPAKAKKVKLVRDSYAMPDSEYAQIGVLKKRLSGLGSDVKKSELLRGGIALLAALNDAELKAVMGRVERIKTGRPAK
ncbi:hypothetical protein [Ferribacterium limneticum]|uniref:hypothetical protein n=1 Tax=Ferribacterium limneticum TaxID=76259 RepID=UPI001CF82D65|nr:hypothetical protein [Ferribacterium limneticum]UCV22370.1 hypothetical protein KI613_17910 [Ferribacterium limneticum]